MHNRPTEKLNLAFSSGELKKKYLVPCGKLSGSINLKSEYVDKLTYSCLFL